MRPPARGAKRTVSQIAGEGSIQQVARRKTEQLRAEIEQDLEAMNAYTARHGSFTDMVREYYGNRDED